jgi:hypothetical protein
MLFFLKLNNRNRGEILMEMSVQNYRQFNNSSTLNRRPIQTVDSMKNHTKRFAAIIGIGLALMMPINRARAQSLEPLVAQWWQWALSIPTSVNPQTDPTGQNAFVGQRGSVWFLAGSFGGGTANRACAVPEDTQLFFPVINGIGINIPNVCGQDNRNLNASQVHALATEAIAGAANLSVTLDGKAITNIQRAGQAITFAVALPGDNVFNAPCGGPGTVPAGIYSPAAGDGFYVLLGPLNGGMHTLRFHADMPLGTSNQDITYHLTVVKVSLK